MVALSIEDNGDGINLETARLKGGLGLKSIYSRVQNLNGKISVESNKNEGTSIYITCYPRMIQESDNNIKPSLLK